MKPVNILLSGAGGRLGHAIAEATLHEANGNFRIIAGIDPNPLADNRAGDVSFPLVSAPADYTGVCDLIIDCSHHTAVSDLLRYAVSRKLPVVIATTGHTEEETAWIRECAHTIPVFHARNLSLGVNLLIALAKEAASTLEGFDIEIVEAHHNKKLDAPSGTALMIADGISEVLPETPVYTYDRHAVRAARDQREIGIHSIRGGTIVGEHEVLFAGQDELIKISHSAASRNIFANGALRAAAFMQDKPAGFYTMDDLVAALVAAKRKG